MTRERAQAPAGGVAVADHAPSAPGNGSPVAVSALALQGSAGNGAVARLAAQGGSAAVLAPGAAGAVAEAAVPTGPIPEMVPATSAAEAREAAPQKRSWWDRVKSAVSDVLSSIGAGLGALTSRVLGAVAGKARQIPGYGLLCVALGKDVVTGQSVPRTAINVISGLVGLIPGGAALFANLQASGAIPRAAAWFGTAWEKVGLTWDYLRGLFRQAWDALGVRDLLDPAGAWAKLQRIFAPPLQRLLAFATAAAAKLLELVFEAGLGMAGPLGARVMAIIRRGGAVIGTIFSDPIGFAGRLVAAVRGGLGKFAGRIGHHLKQGLFGWLTGALRGAITLPEKFDLRGILSLVLQLLGATWTWLRTRMVRLLGEDRVALLEKAVDWVQRIATEGLSAVWERIAEFATGLVDNVLDAIKQWVGKSVVGAAITKLVTMFNPAGAVIQAIIAAYNTIRFFIERAQQLATLANAVFDSIGAIAGGALGNAMDAVENALSRALPVAIGFLARLIGLGDVATPVKGLIERARGVIDQAMDRVIGWLAGLVRGGGVLARAGRAASRGVERVTDAVGAGLRRVLALSRGFTTSRGERHSLFFRRRGDRAQLTIASTPQPFRVFISTIRPNSASTPGGDLDYALRLADEIERLESTTSTTGQDNSARITTLLQELGRTVLELMNVMARRDLRASAPVYGGLQNGFGRGIRVTLLSHDRLTGGSKPSVKSANFATLNRRRGADGSYYVLGHLLNERLGGPGTTWLNLTPLSRSGNAQHERQVESIVKPIEGVKPRAFLYVVTVSYGRGINSELLKQINDPANPDPAHVKLLKSQIVRAEADVPTTIVCSIRELDPDSGQQYGMSETYTIPNPVDQGSPAAYEV